LHAVSDLHDWPAKTSDRRRKDSTPGVDKHGRDNR
jgi:hypothetical protein